MYRNILLTGLLWAVASTPAYAIKNEDIIKTMEPDAASAYVGATVEAISYMAFLLGNEEGYRCILNWYFQNDHVQGKVARTLASYPDKTPQPVIFALIETACGDPRGSRK